MTLKWCTRVHPISNAVISPDK